MFGVPKVTVKASCTIILFISAVIFLYGDSLFGSDVSTGYGAPTSSYGAPEASYGAPEASYGAPAASYGAPAPAYGAPSYAANRYYVSSNTKINTIYRTLLIVLELELALTNYS